jgi:hypothetical protein
VGKRIMYYTFSKCFLSNGTKKIHILASGPEPEAVRFGYVNIGQK